MNISVSIDFMQLKNAVAQCDVNEKLKLLRLLENETFPLPRLLFFNDEIIPNQLTGGFWFLFLKHYFARVL